MEQLFLELCNVGIVRIYNHLVNSPARLAIEDGAE